MNSRLFQTGLIKAKFCKLVRFGGLSLAGVFTAIRWLVKLDWLKILQAIKLLIEITRNLLFYQQPHKLIGKMG